MTPSVAFLRMIVCGQRFRLCFWHGWFGSVRIKNQDLDACPWKDHPNWPVRLIRAIAEWFELGKPISGPNFEDFCSRHMEVQSELQIFISDYACIRGNSSQRPAAMPLGQDASSELSPTKIWPEETAGSVTVSARYRDLRLYKQGGLGILYAAADESLHRDSVVKFLNDKGQDEAASRKQFQIEAEITARLDHPGVAPVYGIGEDWKGRPFYVMRLIRGRELSQAIQDYHALPANSAGKASRRRELFNLLEHLVRACNTVAYAHDRGIVHCDLKPANIMIGKYGETFVLDWGLAQAFERTSTFHRSEPTMRPRSVSDPNSSGHRGGTLGYISPEQLHPDESIGPPSDVYSLGATLYQILTGNPPFNGRDRNVVELIRSGTFPHPRQVRKSISRRLEAICLKAMSLQPQSRYATAKQLAADLSNWMRDEEILARPDRWFQRIARYSRRHRTVTASAVILLVAVCVGAAWADRTFRMEQHDWILQKSMGTALDTFEELCRPTANGGK